MRPKFKITPHENYGPGWVRLEVTDATGYWCQWLGHESDGIFVRAYRRWEDDRRTLKGLPATPHPYA